ncbi:hypothetical protein EKO04_008602 [Ascochyta lentis]|uniref:Uncharacterized protein n=1 Tax=Ascochyta lentis TaxID=205686 RepID=A0A8H7IYG3_9PLEO|nr:hypothetical protein EKO04_008602 [Ascochyta lentis]
MAPLSQDHQCLREGRDSVKDECEQGLLDDIPERSTIAQFITSGQAAFGGVNTQPLKKQNGKTGEVQKWILDRVCERLADTSELNLDDIQALRPLLKLEYHTGGLGSPSSTGFSCLLPELLRLMKSNITYAVTFSNYVLDAPDDEVPQAIKQELLCSVTHILGAVSVDTRDQETIKRQQAAFEDAENGSLLDPQSQAKLTAAAFGIFTKRLYSTGFFEPIESMLANLRTQMVHARSIELHIIYVPFLQKLIGLMLVYGIPLQTATYSAFFEVVLQQYLERFVGQEVDRRSKAEQEDWNQRAFAARVMLESFDHSYFREILGERYDRCVLPALSRLPDIAPSGTRSPTNDTLTIRASTQAGTPKTTVTASEDNTDHALTASTLSLGN